MKFKEMLDESPAVTADHIVWTLNVSHLIKEIYDIDTDFFVLSHRHGSADWTLWRSLEEEANEAERPKTK